VVTRLSAQVEKTPCKRLPLLVRDDVGGLSVWDAESGQLHRTLDGFEYYGITALASFLSADGQQARLVAGSGRGHVRVYDPEAGSTLHHLNGGDFVHGHASSISALACIASSSAAPHHPRLISAAYDGSARVWDGETGELLAELRGHDYGVRAVVAWKEHEGGHDRIATVGSVRVRVWDGGAFTLMHDLDCTEPIKRVLAFESAEGTYRLLVAPLDGIGRGVRVYDPEKGRLLQDGINQYCPFLDWHLFESAEGRYFLTITGSGRYHRQHLGDKERPFLDVWDIGEAPARAGSVRPAHHLG
jgi:WD40 repeat protein